MAPGGEPLTSLVFHSYALPLSLSHCPDCRLTKDELTQKFKQLIDAASMAKGGKANLDVAGHA